MPCSKRGAHPPTHTCTYPQVVKPNSPKVTPQTEMQPMILVVEDTEADPELESGWELILYNDEVNSRHHVGASRCGVPCLRCGPPIPNL